jgi:2-polyprenyl-3-methyl-5-hydroxy-6-metoxy-1,4-benzoquinol methylase
MVCCTGYCAAEAQFDRKVAERDLRRYRRRGADATTRLKLAELRRWPLEGQRLLDVGGGIGVIGRELASTGVASATVVEASPAYLEVARREAGSQYGSRPTQFIMGDFAVIAGTLSDADVVTLDRVVCCYPDAEALLRQAAGRARQLLAFTYPRNRWYVRTLIVLENLWLRLTGKKFRAFVHAPERMAAVLEAAGSCAPLVAKRSYGHSTSIAEGAPSNTHMKPAASGICRRLRFSITSWL